MFQSIFSTFSGLLSGASGGWEDGVDQGFYFQMHFTIWKSNQSSDVVFLVLRVVSQMSNQRLVGVEQFTIRRQHIDHIFLF